jgi:drug/metabolite transporter (DMT)-like permease
LTNTVWLVGLGAQLVGVVLQAAALDRGRVAIIQPLLVTTVIWALPLGYFLTNQVITRRHILGAAVVVAGLAVFASFGDPAGGLDNAPGSAWLSAFVVLGTICVCLLLFGTAEAISPLRRRSTARSRGSFTESRNLHEAGRRSSCIRTAWPASSAGWELWVMAIGGLGGFYIQQISLATGKLVTSVATVSVTNPVVSVMLGVLVLEERLDQPPAWHVVLRILGLALALFGAGADRIGVRRSAGGRGAGRSPCRSSPPADGLELRPAPAKRRARSPCQGR